MIFNGALRISLALVLSCVAGLFAFLIIASQSFWLDQGVGVVLKADWYPYEGLYGMLPALLGTLWSVGLALLIAVPTALAAAILTSEMVSGAAAAMLRFIMELLAGVPSVVYGLLGLWVLLPWLQSGLGLLSGHSLLAAGILLAVMVLPTMMLMSVDALSGVHAAQREAAVNLGMNWSERLFFLLLPQAWPGIRAGILLAMGRALGETMAVMLVVGSMDRLPEPFYNILQPAQTFTSRIGREIGEAAFGSLHFSALIACGLILAIISIINSMLTHRRRVPV